MLLHHTFNKVFIAVITASTEGRNGDAVIEGNGVRDPPSF